MFTFIEISKIVREPVYYYNSMTFFRLLPPLIFLNNFQGRVWTLLTLAKYFAQFDLACLFSASEYENFQGHRKFEIFS